MGRDGQRNWVHEKRRSKETGSVRRDRQRKWVHEKRRSNETGPERQGRTEELDPWEETGKGPGSMRRDGPGMKGKTGQQSWVRGKRRSNETGP